jgi:hypothetical protein
MLSSSCILAKTELQSSGSGQIPVSACGLRGALTGKRNWAYELTALAEGGLGAVSLPNPTPSQRPI